MTLKPTREITLPYTHLEFYDSFVISTFKEDQVLDKEKVEEMRVIFYDYFDHKKFVYISNRKHKYNVNPVIYIDLIQRNILLGMAIIINEIDGAQIANFEKQFATVPFEMFYTREEALVWTKRLLEENK
ncbi:hypothetical protein [Christiangramia sp. SM2212]|uniref:STAS/SEC14 domain-containing protein n=1 Tax=Christiangramia sediminicola TaxID=3073267 RepID=A0ABU1EPY4_9FLAO|nr:hypothetical protein [Christiangramia sp. SM2212]MDR5590449.1 hypothetical protein [Christiangramia sp. SM2212]